ncbi:MAG: hypothetical protein ACNA7Z_09575, partial [Dethiobacteria bacterium]
MVDFKRFQNLSGAPSKLSLEKTYLSINSNLAEMRLIVNSVSNYDQVFSVNDKYRLLYLGSLLYDFYMLCEDCLLNIARLTDKWVPASLDWHYRLLILMQSPVPEKRPPVLSSETAAQLGDYLCLYLNFHHQCSDLSPARIIKMTKDLSPLFVQLE